MKMNMDRFVFWDSTCQYDTVANPNAPNNHIFLGGLWFMDCELFNSS